VVGEQMPWRDLFSSVRAWSDVAHNFRGDWQMLWKEITIRFLLAGFIAQFGNGFFEHLFIRNAPARHPGDDRPRTTARRRRDVAPTRRPGRVAQRRRDAGRW
jgi:hypothetical protein